MRVTYHKLIRDNIPAIIQRSGGRCCAVATGRAKQGPHLPRQPHSLDSVIASERANGYVMS